MSDTSSHPALRRRVVPFLAGDGLPLNLVHVRGESLPSRGVVLLVHGAGVRANVFQAPVDTTLVDTLVAQGFDVWLENWRASIDVPPTDWTLDQAALYDHPAAVRTVLAETGADSLQAVIHCQGSTSFMMSAIAGMVPQVDTIVSNRCRCTPSSHMVSVEAALRGAGLREAQRLPEPRMGGQAARCDAASTHVGCQGAPSRV